jgi:hypothetical protein
MNNQNWRFFFFLYLCHEKMKSLYLSIIIFFVLLVSRSQNSWSLLPTQAMFSSVLPGEYMSGHVQGMIQFPSWLGKNSKQNKVDRMLQELQMHTRLRLVSQT